MKVLQVEPWTFLDARHNPVEGYKVTFRTDLGMTGTIDIAKADFAPEKVSDLVGEEAVKIDTVMSLTTEG